MLRHPTMPSSKLCSRKAGWSAMYYLDTCICVEFLRGRLQYGYQEMRNNQPSDFRLPAIVAAELWFGAEHSANPERECAIVDAFLQAFEIQPFDVDAAREYGRIRQLLGSQGAIIGDRDMMVAASALVAGATLVTDNLSEFARVPNLKIESWAEGSLP